MESVGTGTPCIRVCKLDSQSKICSGCFRTPDEIKNWLLYTDEQQEKIKTLLSLRRELLWNTKNFQS